MKRKTAKIIAIITLILALIASLMFTEYRYIMHHIEPYKGENNTVYLKIFGQVDEYYADYAENMYE